MEIRGNIPINQFIRTALIAVLIAAGLPSSPAKALSLSYLHGQIGTAQIYPQRRQFHFTPSTRAYRPSFRTTNQRGQRWDRRQTQNRRHNPRESQPIFRVTHENHAWGHQKSSCEIRDDGSIMLAQFAAPPDRVLGYEEIGRLSNRDVDRMLSLLTRAAGRGMTEPRQVMADFGTTTLSGLYRGRAIDLKISGDFVSINPSRAAQQLTAQLSAAFPTNCPGLDVN